MIINDKILCSGELASSGFVVIVFKILALFKCLWGG